MQREPLARTKTQRDRASRWPLGATSLAVLASDVALFSMCAGCEPRVGEPGATTGAQRQVPTALRWRQAHHETFDAPFPDPPWVEDHHGPDSPYHVDRYDDDGEHFSERGGAAFAARLASFRSFRKSFTYGERGWLTVELYGRDSDRDGAPESGGRFTSASGKAHLVSARHYDGAIIRSTRPLPARYRVEVTVSDIRFGGDIGGSWTPAGRFNGYDGDELADPWSFRDGDPTPRRAVGQNGVYFLCITDYARPAPHNNVFIHHHRKVVMDTDNNDSPTAIAAGRSEAWSKVWNPAAQRPEVDGSRYVSMIWLDGEHPRHDWTGNRFLSWAGDRWFADDIVFVDKYLPGERYRFVIERDGQGYAMSVTGRFQHGGERTYRARRGFEEAPATWHFNQTPAERTRGAQIPGWPAASAYPDHFFFGDPHINFYEGSADFDDLSLHLPDEQ